LLEYAEEIPACPLMTRPRVTLLLFRFYSEKAHFSFPSRTPMRSTHAESPPLISPPNLFSLFSVLFFAVVIRIHSVDEVQLSQSFKISTLSHFFNLPMLRARPRFVLKPKPFIQRRCLFFLSPSFEIRSRDPYRLFFILFKAFFIFSAASPPYDTLFPSQGLFASSLASDQNTLG